MYRHRYLRCFWSEIGKYFVFMGIGCMTCSHGVSQVLNCEVQVTADVQLGNVLDQERIEDLSKGMSDYLNNTAWTRDEFLPYERIKCTMVLNIKSASSTGQYGGSMQILSLRPVYGATYETPLLNFTEDWNFTYNVGQPLRYTLSGTMEELEALLAFYAYLILGLDYDSFSLEGGTPYFQQAQEVVNRVRSSGSGGWSSFGSLRNRYWLLENMIDAQLKPLRSLTYGYHRLGLDSLGINKASGQARVMEQLRVLSAVSTSRPVLLWVITWMDTKYMELISLCKELEQEEQREECYNILRRLDPARTQRYRRIVE